MSTLVCLILSLIVFLLVILLHGDEQACQRKKIKWSREKSYAYLLWKALASTTCENSWENVCLFKSIFSLTFIMRDSDVHSRTELVRDVYWIFKLTWSKLFKYCLFKWGLLCKSKMPCPLLLLKLERLDLPEYTTMYTHLIVSGNPRRENMSSKC